VYDSQLQFNADQWSLGNPDPRVAQTILGHLFPTEIIIITVYYYYLLLLLYTVRYSSSALRSFTSAPSYDFLYVTHTKQHPVGDPDSRV
jgi:hypothetical protein